MLKNVFIILVFFIGHGYLELFPRIDGEFLQSLFTPLNSYFVISKGYTQNNVKRDFNKENEIIVTTFLEENCMLECLRNSYCIRYSFNGTEGICKIRLHPNKRKNEFDQKIVEKINEELSMELEKCTNGIYCPDLNNEERKEKQQVICDPLQKVGKYCQHEIKFELTEWTEWSQCSVTCQTGFTRRDRFCQMKYFNETLEKEVTVIVENNDLLCINNSKTEIEVMQVKECDLGNCNAFGKWGEWGGCSKVCSGFRSRSRECTNTNNSCDHLFLNETETCGLEGCANSIIKLQNPTNTGSKNASVFGRLILYNTETRRMLRIFTYTSNQNTINKIALVACNEFGYNGYSWVVPADANGIKNQFKGNEKDYFKFINEKSLNGIECIGNETSIKNCQVASNATVNTNLFELELECHVNGYWSEWSAWVEKCTAPCGKGGRKRQRTCTNPRPTNNEFSKGLNCKGLETEIADCIMPNCPKPG